MTLLKAVVFIPTAFVYYKEVFAEIYSDIGIQRKFNLIDRDFSDRLFY